MKLRLIITIASASLLVIGLAGCTGTPAQKHLTAAQKCTPTTAKVQWESDDVDSNDPRQNDPNDANYVPVNATLLDYSEGNGVAVITQHDIGPRVQVNFTDGNEVIDATGASYARWKRGLLQSVRLTGQVPTEFGQKEKFSDNEVSVDTKTGKFLNVNMEYLTTVPFEIECTGVKHIDGSVTGVIPGAFQGVLVGCGQKAHRHTMRNEKTALALTKTYCGS